MYTKRVKIEGTVSIVCDDSDVIVAHITESVLGRFNLHSEDSVNGRRDGPDRRGDAEGLTRTSGRTEGHTTHPTGNKHENSASQPERTKSETGNRSMEETVGDLHQRPTNITSLRPPGPVTVHLKKVDTSPSPRRAPKTMPPLQIKQPAPAQFKAHLNGNRHVAPSDTEKYKLLPVSQKTYSSDQREGSSYSERRSAFHIPLFLDNHMAPVEGGQRLSAPSVAPTSITERMLQTKYSPTLSPDQAFPQSRGMFGNGLTAANKTRHFSMGDINCMRQFYTAKCNQSYRLVETTPEGKNRLNLARPEKIQAEFRSAGSTPGGAGPPLEFGNAGSIQADTFSKTSPPTPTNLPAPYIQMNSFYVKKDDITLDQYITNTNNIHTEVFNMPTHKCPYCERIFATSTKLWKHIRRENCNSKSYMIETPAKVRNHQPEAMSTVENYERQGMRQVSNGLTTFGSDFRPSCETTDVGGAQVKREVPTGSSSEPSNGHEPITKMNGSVPFKISTDTGIELDRSVHVKNSPTPVTCCSLLGLSMEPLKTGAGHPERATSPGNPTVNTVIENGAKDDPPKRLSEPFQPDPEDVALKKLCSVTDVQQMTPMTTIFANGLISKTDACEATPSKNGLARKTNVCVTCQKRFNDRTSLFRHKVLKHSNRLRRAIVCQKH